MTCLNSANRNFAGLDGRGHEDDDVRRVSRDSVRAERAEEGHEGQFDDNRHRGSQFPVSVCVQQTARAAQKSGFSN